MDIDITAWVEANGVDAPLFSGSIAEYGNNAAQITWGAAKGAVCERQPKLLKSKNEIDMCRRHLRAMGFDSDNESNGDRLLSTYTNADVRALFVQLISADLRELWGLHRGDGIGGVDWEGAADDQAEGRIASNMFVSGDKLYFTLDG